MKYNLKLTLASLIAIFLTTAAQASIMYSGLDVMDGSIVDDSNDTNATTYSGTWSESVTGATGMWSLDITYNSTDTLVWEVNAGESTTVGSPTGTGGGLVLDFRGPDVAQGGGASNTLLIEFSMTVDQGRFLLILAIL